MTLRGRLTLVAAVAVAISIAAASLLIYALTRRELLAQVDQDLGTRASMLTQLSGTPGEADLSDFEFSVFVLSFTPGATPPLGRPQDLTQLIDADGEVLRSLGDVDLPTDDRARSVATGDGEAFIAGQEFEGKTMRVITVGWGEGLALQVARPLEELEGVLGRLRVVLGAVSAAGIAIAAVLGLGVGRTALLPVHRLTVAAEEVAATRDLGRRIEVGGKDELGRLGASFNAMLEALDESLRAQRRLVADASHELRTPLTSLRTNVELLAGATDLQPEEEGRMVAEIGEQVVELSNLIGDLIDLARGEEVTEEVTDVRLDQLVERGVERARLHWPEVRFVVSADESLVAGRAGGIERAIANLLDNAGKWSPSGAEVEVIVREGEVVVADHGPGIDPADLPFVFDRFYRSASARSVPGSGLGLAIVRQVAESNGGSVTVETPEGGGSRFHLKLPTTS